MKRLLLFATTMLLAVSCIKVVLPTKKGAEAEEAATETEAVVEAVEEVAEVLLPKVYSNAYDGYLNVRAQPTTKSQVVGKLNNGPEGAELLGVEGKWSKVRVNGVEGYVSSAYVQSTPTQPVYINASAVVGHFGRIDSIIGYEWIYSINSNGKYTFGEYDSGECDEESGKWYLSGTSIIFKSTTGSTRTFKVDAQGGRLIDGDDVYHRLN